MPKITIASTVIVAILLAFYLSNAAEYLSVEGVREQLSTWRSLIARQPVYYGFLIAFFFTVLLATPLPVTAISTLSSGYLFGFWTGLLIISICSLCSAVIDFLIARYVARDYVKNKFSALNNIDGEIRQSGIWYALSLRLFPVLPFFVLNCLQGISSLRLRSFMLGTFIGMIPISMILVNAGTQLANIDSLDDVVTPELMISFFLVALVPLIFRFIARRCVASGDGTA